MPTSQREVIRVEEYLRSTTLCVGFGTSEKETSQMMASFAEAMSILIQVVEGTEQINKLRLQS
jgi:PII-like signaling protein